MSFHFASHFSALVTAVAGLTFFSASVAAEDVLMRAVTAPTQIESKKTASIPLIIPKKGSSIPLADENDHEDIPARTVYFELNPVDGITKYNIQVKTLTQHWLEPYTAELDGTTLRLRMTPGRYKLRTRSLPDNDEAGRWSRWQDFWIHFKSPKNIFPAENSIIVPKGGSAERVVFEWPTVKFAKSYIFTLYNSEGEMLKHVRTRLTYVGADLHLNANYAWSLVPQSAPNEPEPEPGTVELHKFRVAEPAPELHKTRLGVEPQMHAVSYDFEFVRLTSDKVTDEPAVYHSIEPEFAVSLAPGEYEMRVRTNYESGLHSNWSAPRKFWVQIKPPKPLGPTPTLPIDPTDDEAAEVVLKWEKPVTEAKFFRVLVWDDKGSLVADETTSETQLKLGLPHQTKYSWTVVAMQEREKSRAPASADDAAKQSGGQLSTFTVEHYKRLGLTSAEESSQLYGWGRYITSVMQYKADNYDNNTRTVQDVFGGTGELALGYWHRKSDFGALFAANEAGFTIGSETYAYTAASLLFGYRWRDDGASTRWRFWFGPTYKETPEILTNPETKLLYFNRLAGIGPELRVSYLGTFNDTYGYHLYASYMTVLHSLHTISDRPLHDTTLANAGLFITYRYSPNILAMAGYSYQIETAKYESADELTHGMNELSFTGHFLSLTLEVGLQKPQR